MGQGATPLDAWRAAYSTDPDSPFGGIIVVNRPFDLALAKDVDEIFTEVLIAPDFTPDALEFLRKKKNRRLLRYRPERIDRSEPDVRHVFGGLLVQQPDLSHENAGAAQVVTARKPTEDELRALAFGWKVVKHVKSNAVVFATRRPHARDRRRADLARRRGARGDARRRRASAIRSPARCSRATRSSRSRTDSRRRSPRARRACVQPGGSARDAEVIAAADRLGIAMVFTGARHFRH